MEEGLPFPPIHKSAEAYVNSLLTLITSSGLLQTLCGGVHILDFLVKEPDLYETILPHEWRIWFEEFEVSDILDLLMREDVDRLLEEFSQDCTGNDGGAVISVSSQILNSPLDGRTWRGRPFPPGSLLQYIQCIRNHSLIRSFEPKASPPVSNLSHDVTVGMKPKKIHEVQNFARYIHDLGNTISSTIGYRISHFVDFGSGQNYLGRALASEPYGKSIIAVESKGLNIDGAKSMDVLARITEKPKVMRNKKAYRSGIGIDRSAARRNNNRSSALNNVNSPKRIEDQLVPLQKEHSSCPVPTSARKNERIQYVEKVIANGDLSRMLASVSLDDTRRQCSPHDQRDSLIPMNERPSFGSNQDLNKSAIDLFTTSSATAPRQPSVIPQPSSTPLSATTPFNPQIMVVSLHSCGNLLHHGLRSLLLNDTVKAVAMVGCCYNLVTERLEPPTYKLSSLSLRQASNARLERTGSTCDENGFPMSKRFMEHEYYYQRADNGQNAKNETQKQTARGIRLNITARMMAVQAPRNWTRHESEQFFTRHFYRALLQRILVDKGVVVRFPSICTTHAEDAGKAMGSNDKGAEESPRGWTGGNSQPIIIGSLRKGCYDTFTTYVRGAISKLTSSSDDLFVPLDKVEQQSRNALDEQDVARVSPSPSPSHQSQPPQSDLSSRIASSMSPTRLPDAEISAYETQFAHRKKHLSIIWSLMAFTAEVVESVIVVDRWLFLREHMKDCGSNGEGVVSSAWVETVFDYTQSPRNLVVCGIKK
ncbi:hypothetical protein MMC09_006419 [Bachmanniomyces sp. S44760]|nr:hypothetical protein [Bachmanniomyces sp. S44760]